MTRLLDLLRFCDISLLKILFLIVLVSVILVLDLISIASIPMFFSKEVKIFDNYLPILKEFDRDYLFLILGACIIGRSCIYFVFQALVIKFGVDVQYRLRYGIIHEELMRSGTQSISANLGTFLHNVQVIGSTVSSLLVQFIQTCADITIGIFLVLFVAFYEPKIFYIFFISFLFIGGLYYAIFRNIAINAGKKENAANSELLTLLKEIFKGINEIQNYRVTDFFRLRVICFLRELSICIIKIRTIGAGSKHILEIAFISVIGIFYLLVGRQQDPEMFFASLGVLAVVGYRLIPAFRSAINFWVTLSNQSDSFFRLEHFFRKKIGPARDAEIVKKKTLTKSIKLIVDDLSLSLPGEGDLFRGLSFEAKPGDFISIMGESGAGKTTLLNCIAGLNKQFDGQISLEMESGNNITSFNEWISYLPQDPSIFSGSILRNICFEDKLTSVDIPALQFAVDFSGCSKFISKPVECQHIQVGENGMKFSGGQVQRICLARAIYFGRPILLIDEGANKLDKNTRLEIYKSLKLISEQGKIVIAVAHDQEIEKYVTKVVTISR